MILDAKPLLWVTALLLASGVGVLGSIAVATRDVPIADIGTFLAGSWLLFGNLAIGAALAEKLGADIQAGSGPLVAMSAFFAKTMLLFVLFALLGQSFGMAPLVLGAAATLVAFTAAVVIVPLFSSLTPMEAM